MIVARCARGISARGARKTVVPACAIAALKLVYTTNQVVTSVARKVVVRATAAAGLVVAFAAGEVVTGVAPVTVYLAVATTRAVSELVGAATDVIARGANSVCSQSRCRSLVFARRAHSESFAVAI